MFSKSKEKKKRKDDKEDTNAKLAKLGLIVPDISEYVLDNDNDSDLEAELQAITSGNKVRSKIKGKKDVSPEELSKMVTECMKEDLDEDISDGEDPDLLAELNELEAAGNEEEDVSSSQDDSSSKSENSSIKSPTEPQRRVTVPQPMMAGSSVLGLLTERIQMYTEAEQNAIATGETHRAKRFNRGLKTLYQMEKSVKAGKTINEDEIPCVVSIKSSQCEVSQKEKLPSSKSSQCEVPQKEKLPSSWDQGLIQQQDNSSQNLIDNIDTRQSLSSLPKVAQLQHQYKMAALNCKKSGEKEEAIKFLRISKQLDSLVAAERNGQSIDLSSLPPPPSEIDANSFPTNVSIQENKQQEVLVQNDNAEQQLEEKREPEAVGPPVPTSALEALQQRLDKYIEQRDKAKSEENSRKERMLQRIVKQYEGAIKSHKAGKLVDFDELPCPPGFAPIPVASAQPANSPPAQIPSTSPSINNASQPKVASGKRAAPPVPKDVRKTTKSRVERQLSLLEKRQSMFKEAALDAKKRGEIEQAKEYLRNYRGIQQLVDATIGGLPVDLNTVPIPPQEKMLSAKESLSLDFEVVDQDDCIMAPPKTPSDIALIYTKLEEDLIQQIKMCARTRQHFKALGDVASSNRFEQLILHTKKDLDAVRTAFKRGDTPPKFHYENRSFTMIQCNTDLNDSDCEVTVVRGINFNVPNPKELDTFVKIEFPYPVDTPPQEKSEMVKDTNSPEFNHKMIFSIDRKARALARVFKRQSVKCTVVNKGRWFHRDGTLGSVKVPLISLENKCTLHESFDLVDEKKKMIGGKLEVKIRIRNPILSKQLEKVTERWIVIDGF